MGSEPTRELDAALTRLRRDFRGTVVAPGDAAFEGARRVWNGAIDRSPSAIAYCQGAADVVAALDVAAGADLAVAVRGAGHSVAGASVCDGGLVIDLSSMRGIRVDPTRRLARVEAGALWGDLDRETQLFSLATTGGIISHSGVAGLTLGGGLGWLMRRHGLSCDNLVSLDLVTADGSCRTVDAANEPELFWALRGGGCGRFGVVTSFELSLHEVGPVMAGVVAYPAEDAAAVLRRYRDAVAAAPSDLTTIVNLRHAPAASFLPAAVHGAPVVLVMLCHAGSGPDAERSVEPFRRLGSPLADTIGRVPYSGFQRMFDAGVPHGLRYYWKSEYLEALDDSTIDALAARAWSAPSRRSYTLLYQLGAGVASVEPASCAFEDRTAAFAAIINCVWEDPGESAMQVAWTRNLWAALRPRSTGRLYLNFLGEDEGEDRVRAAYGAAKYERLVALKRAFDPGNRFPDFGRRPAP